MNRKLVIALLAGLVLAITLFFLVWTYVFRKAETNVASHKPDYVIDAQELVRSFESDEELANTNFLGKVILVTGLVNSVTLDSLGGSIYLLNADEVSGVLCSFTKEDLNLDKVYEGKLISIKGICTGYLMDVNLNKCSIIDR